jgi:DNA primase
MVGDFAQTLKQQADIVRIVGEYVRLKRAGAQNYTGLCPFHGEKTPSFSIHATRQFFHCFGCGESGDVFKFLQKIENISFPEAVRLLAQKLGVPMPKMHFDSPAEAREARLRGTLLDLHEAACQFFQKQLRRPEAAHAREYLKGRGLNEEAIARFRIGYAPESGFLLRDALQGQAEEDVLRESGLFSWKEHSSDAAGARTPASGSQAQAASPDGETAAQGTPAIQTGLPGTPAGPALSNGSSQEPKPDEPPTLPADATMASAGGPVARGQRSALYSRFRNRVLFPICNEQGKIIAFTGRTLSADEKSGPKYLNSPETAIYQKSRVLYNLNLAKQAIRELDYAILVEGQMDCISVFNAGLHNVIASSGTAFTEIQARLLSRFSRKIVVNFDPDTAGAAAAERSLGLLVSEDFEIRVLTLEQGFDPDLFIRRKGADAYKQALRGSQKYFDYLIERARKQFPVRTAEGKVKAVNYLLPHIQRVNSRIARDEIAAEVAQKLQIDSAVLRQELRHVAGARAATRVASTARAEFTDAERVLIRALAGAATEAGAAASEAGPHDASSERRRPAAREGGDPEFDPRRQAHFALLSERLHEGLPAEALLESLRLAFEQGQDPLSLELPEPERRLLAMALMEEQERLTPELLQATLDALRRRRMGQRQRELKVLIAEAEQKQDSAQLGQLLREKLEIDKALRAPEAVSPV